MRQGMVLVYEKNLGSQHIKYGLELIYNTRLIKCHLVHCHYNHLHIFSSKFNINPSIY